MGPFHSLSNRVRDAMWNWLSEGRSTMLLTQEEKQKQDIVMLARKYYDGDQVVKMTNRQKEWLELHGKKVKWTVNHCPTVVNAVVERLQVIGFDVAGEEQSESEDNLKATAWRWWQENRMDAVQTEAHRMAVRDAEAFILITWNDQEGRPDWVLHPRYVDDAAGGDGYGMWMEYPNDDYLQKPTRAIKQWKETTKDAQDRPTTRTRRTVYYPDRVERFVKGRDGAWEPFRDLEDDAWPVAWTTEADDPLGIPVIHLRNPGLKSELADIIPLQDALNKTWLDILAAEDSTSFRTTILLGLVPTTDGKTPQADGSNLLKLLPGVMWASEKKPSEAQVITLDPATLAPLLEAEDRIVFRIASISGTPLSRFLTTRQVMGAESQKEGEGPLLGKVRERMTLFGNAWEDLIVLSARIANRFGGASFEDRPKLSTVWEPAEVRNETEHLDSLGKKKELGVDEETVWTEMGYDKRKIKQFRREKKKREQEMVRANARTPPATGQPQPQASAA